MTDDAVLVHEEDRPSAHAAFIVEDAVGLADGAVRPVIGQQWKRQAAEVFRPGLQAGDGVGTELEDFDVELLEFFVVLTEPEDLVPSPAGEREGQEGHDGLAALEAAQRELAVHVGRSREIGRLRSRL